MKPRIKTFLVLLLSFTLVTPAIAATKVGTSCTKIGSSVTERTGILICAKVGKSKKFILKPPTKVSTKPTSNSVVPTPDPTPAPYEGLASQSALLAFDSISNYLKTTPDLPSGFVLVELSPHAQQTLADATLKDLQKGARFWQAFTSSSSKIHMVFADRSDLNWFQEEMIKWQPNNTGWLERIMTLAKERPEAQYAGANGGDIQNNSLFFFLPGTGTVSTSSGWLGSGPHEWTHSAQQAISGDIYKLPCWFKEGQATLYGNAISNNSRSDWAAHWKRELNTIAKDNYPDFYKINTVDLTSWFQKHTYNMPNNVCGPDGVFSIGPIATEYLVGTLGVNKVNDLVAQLSTGGKWEPYLEKLIGKPIDQIMSEIVAYVLSVRTWMTSTA